MLQNRKSKCRFNVEGGAKEGSSGIIADDQPWNYQARSR
jgi:hypothetical protein